MNRLRITVLSVCSTWIVTTAVVFAEPPQQTRVRELAQLFPDSTVACLEVPNPRTLVDQLLAHPLREKIESLPDVKQGLRSAEYIQFRLVVSWFELQLGMSWDEALRSTTARGIVAGVDSQTEGIAIVAHGESEEVVTRLVKTLVGVARRDAKRRDVELPYKEHKYRGVTAYQFDDLLIASVGDRLLVANKSDLAKSITDAMLDSPDEKRLTDKDNYRSACEIHDVSNDARAYVDLQFLRSAGVAKELFRDRAENIAAEFLLGMLMEGITDAPVVSLAFNVSDDDAVLNVQVPHAADATSQARQYAFGPQGTDHAPFELLADRTISSIVSYRDLGQLWLAKEELLEEDQVAELAQADSNLTTVFSGLDFGEEVLGSTQPGIQLLVATQDFAGDRELPVPDIRLPSFATIFRLKEPEKIKRRFKIGFQSFVGFVNIEQGQSGQPQFDVETERGADGVQITSASYFLDERFEEATAGLINYNFSPTIAFVDDWFVLSSTKQLATELVAKARQATSAGSEAQANTAGTLEMAELIAALQVNRDHLVAQNMLETGNSRDESVRETETLLELLASVRDFDFHIKQTANTLSLELGIEFATNRAQD